MVLPAFISDQHGEIKENNGITSGFSCILSGALDEEFSQLRSDEVILAAVLLNLQPVSGSGMFEMIGNHPAFDHSAGCLDRESPNSLDLLNSPLPWCNYVASKIDVPANVLGHLLSLYCVAGRAGSLFVLCTDWHCMASKGC